MVFLLIEKLNVSRHGVEEGRVCSKRGKIGPYTLQVVRRGLPPSSLLSKIKIASSK
jgi:hypothetical protein